MNIPLHAGDVKVALLDPAAMRDPRRPTLAELNAAMDIGPCHFDPYPEVRRVARRYAPTGFTWFDKAARPLGDYTGSVTHPCIGYVDATGRRHVAHQDGCPHTTKERP